MRFREINEIKNERISNQVTKNPMNGFNPDMRIKPTTNVATDHSTTYYDVDKRIIIK